MGNNRKTSCTGVCASCIMHHVSRLYVYGFINFHSVLYFNGQMVINSSIITTNYPLSNKTIRIGKVLCKISLIKNYEFTIVVCGKFRFQWAHGQRRPNLLKSFVFLVVVAKSILWAAMGTGTNQWATRINKEFFTRTV